MKFKKRKNKYEKIERKVNRKTLSYEDMPLEDYEQPGSKLTWAGIKKLFKALAIVAVACGVVLLIINWKNISFERTVEWIEGEMFGTGIGDGYPYPISGTSVLYNNFVLMDDKLVVASDTSISMLSTTAKELANRQHSYSTPAVKTSKNKAILYSLGGTGYRVENKSATLVKKNTEEKILSADINNDGTYALLTEATGYLSRMVVFTSKNEQRYKYSFADYYANLISLSDNDKKAAVAGFSAVNGGLESAVYVIDFSEEKPQQTFKFDDEFIIAISFIRNDRIVAVGDKASYIIDVESGKTKKYSYNNLTLTNYSIDKEGGLALSLSISGDGNRCNVVSVNLDGEKTMELPTHKRIISISNRDDKVVYIAEGTAYCYDTSGTLIGAFSAGNDAGKILMLNKNTAYIMGISEIRQISLS